MKLIGIIFVALSTTIALSQVSCDAACQSESAESYHKIAATLVRGGDDAGALFQQLPYEQQVDLHLYARFCKDDPRFVRFTDRADPQLIEAIVQKIETPTPIWNKAELVGVLFGINIKCDCIGRDPNIISRLAKVESKIESDPENKNRREYIEMFSRRLKLLRGQLKPGDDKD